MRDQGKRSFEFGPFRLDADERTLLRRGEMVALTPKAVDTLLALVERSGRVVDKDELMRAVWPDVYVEEGGLARNISVLRKVLGEDEGGRGYIETVPKRGYRFVGEVREVPAAAELVLERHTQSRLVLEEEVTNAEGECTSESPPRPHRWYAAATGSPEAEPVTSNPKILPRRVTSAKHRRSVMAIGAALALVALVALWFASTPPPPKVLSYSPVTNDGRQKWAGSPIVTDGSRLYFGERGGNRGFILAQVAVAGGETVPLSLSLPAACVIAISPDRSELLVSSPASEFEAPLWVLPIPGGSPRRLGDMLAHDGAWSPDGQRIAYASGSGLYVCRADGTESDGLATVVGTPWWLDWSPDSTRLRFTVVDPRTDATSLWEVAADGSDLHPLLPGWNPVPAESCGRWTPDGAYYVFQSSRGGTTNLWAIRETQRPFRRHESEPVQLTAGPLSFSHPVASPNGHTLFAAGELQRGELVRYDAQSGQFTTYLSGISAEGVSFSRDGNWITYVAYPEGTLWRSKLDGSERRQLTSPPMHAALPRWSPDGRQIVFMATAPGKPLRIYEVTAEGGPPQELLPEEREQADPNWSPDGRSVVFGGLNGMSLNDPSTMEIRLLDLPTKRVSVVPGSQGLCSPRWSPDGRYLLALSVGSHRLMLFDFTTSTWECLAEGDNGYPSWSRDGRFIYFVTNFEENDAVVRLRLTDRKTERVADLTNLRPAAGEYGQWTGLAPDDSVMMLRNIGSSELYALEWQAP